ncbi:MAG: hypothetical protein ACJAUV_002179 [Flavobacteriales bacterium]|jgi:hypothetical protein
MRIKIISLLLCIVTISSYAQVPHESAKSTSQSKNEAIASRYISSLREGTLIVRISYGSNKKAALKVKGHTKKLIAYTQELEYDNSLLIAAFLGKYTFSKVLFFYDKNIDKILNREWKHLFLNTKTLKIDSTIEFNEKAPYYILGTESIYFELQNSSSSGLVVMDKDLTYLKEPFPYYVISMGDAGPLAKSIEFQVIKLNDQFLEFYAMYGTKY